MFPRLFEIHGFGLPTYGVLAAIALVAGLMLAVHLARRQGLDPEHAWNIGLIAVFASIAGSKLLLVINDWGYYSSHPRALLSLATLQAGGVFYGGLVAGVAAALVYVVRHGMPVLKTADVFGPAIALGHTIGRLGCLAAGCCYGKPAQLPWSVTFTNPLARDLVGTPLNIPLHPTQIYEALTTFAIFLLLLWLLAPGRRQTGLDEESGRPRRRHGQVAGAYLFLYGLARYFLEFLRDDPERGSVFGGAMTVTQLISILLVIVGGALWLRPKQRSQESGVRGQEKALTPNL